MLDNLKAEIALMNQLFTLLLEEILLEADPDPVSFRRP